MYIIIIIVMWWITLYLVRPFPNKNRTPKIGTTSEERATDLFPKCPFFGGSTITMLCSIIVDVALNQ